jgi:hypothetical protein
MIQVHKQTDEVNFVLFETYSMVVKYILSTFEELNP